MKKQSGFTLIELMIVVVIIGILSAIAYPSYTTYLKESARSDAKVGLVKLADKQERYYLQNNTYTTTIGTDGLETGAVSDEGYYTFTITSANASGFEMKASAAAGTSQISDTGCTELKLTSTGVKSPSGCW